MSESSQITFQDRLNFIDEVNRGRNDPIWFIKEKLGLKTLFPKQEEIVKTFYRHLYPDDFDNADELKTLILVAGQRSGKTVLASAILCYEFFKLISLENPAEHYGLLAHQNLACTCVAAGSDQAKDGVYSLARGFLEENEWFKKWWPTLKFKEDRVELKDKHVFMQIRAANTSTAAGYTNACVVMDELDLFAKTESRLGAELVYTKLKNSTATLGKKGKVIAISSLQGIDGLMSKLYNEGQNEKSTLTYKLPTWEVNLSIKKEDLLEEYKYKMDAFYRDFANMPEVSTGLMFPGGVKLNKNIINIFDCEQIPDEYFNYSYVLAADPAFRNDAFGVAIGYRWNNEIVINGVTKFEKEVSDEAYIKPSDIENFIMHWVNLLNIETFIYDVDLVLATVEKLETNHGITCIKHLAGEDTYSLWASLNDGLGDFDLHVVYNEHLKRDVEQLVKKELPSGKIRVDHTYTSQKDVPDAVSNVIWWLANNDTAMVRAPVVTSIIR